MRDNIIRLILCVLGVIFIALFMFPYLTLRTLNVGNITGLLISGGAVLYAVAYNKMNNLIKHIWSSVCGRVFLCIIGALAAFIIAVAVILTIKMTVAATKRPSGDSTVIVLGCQVHSTGPSVMLAERLDAAYDYLIKNPQAKCIVSGGKGADEPMAEGECMYNYLIERGISADRLYVENKSTTTLENLTFSLHIIEDNSLSKQIAIATNEFHEYRACKIGRELGLDCSAISARTAFPLFPTFYVRELFAIIAQFVLNMG